MPRKAANKTKAWRKDYEIHMMPQEVQSTNEEGEILKSISSVPYILKGRMLRDYRLHAGKMKPPASNLMINLMTNGGFDTINNVENDSSDQNIPSDLSNESNVETV